MKSIINFNCLPISYFILILLSLSSIYAQAESLAGKVIKAEGAVYAQIEEQEKRKLSLGKSVYEKDLVSTGDDSSVSVVFNDKTRFELGENSSMLVSKYIYTKDVEKDSTSIEVLKGAFRFVSGLIAKEKPDSMKVKTVVATIGIRGTNVIGKVDGTSATVILVEPEDPSHKTAIEVFNEFGSVTIDEPGYGTDIPDANSAPTPPRRMSLQTINNLTRSIQQSVQRLNIPRPRF